MGGGSPISSTGETLTARPPEADEQPIEDPVTPETHPEGGKGSSPHGSSANGSSPASQSLVGQSVEGVVTGITHFGVFVNLDGGQNGLIHISEIAYEYVRDVGDHLKLNERVPVKVLQANPANGKYELPETDARGTRRRAAQVAPRKARQGAGGRF